MKSLLVIGLCLASLLSAGCASTKGPGNATSRDRLPFPASYPRNPTVTAPFATDTVANVVSYTNYRDPIIWYNRSMFAINDVVYRFLVIPAANAYTWVIPDPVERCVANFFYNVKSPIYAVNHLLQFEFRATGRDIARFGVNTTVGVLGLFDPARSWLKIEREETHLENTLAKYGAGYGFYFVLPLLGPSDLRNAPSMLADRFLNPFTYILDTPTSLAVGTFDYFQDYAPSAEDYRILREKTDDPYIFYRNLYLQGVQRDADYEKAR